MRWFITKRRTPYDKVLCVTHYHREETDHLMRFDGEDWWEINDTPLIPVSDQKVPRDHWPDWWYPVSMKTRTFKED